MNTLGHLRVGIVTEVAEPHRSSALRYIDSIYETPSFSICLRDDPLGVGKCQAATATYFLFIRSVLGLLGERQRESENEYGKSEQQLY
jgi:hypothetical protein